MASDSRQEPVEGGVLRLYAYARQEDVLPLWRRVVALVSGASLVIFAATTLYGLWHEETVLARVAALLALAATALLVAVGERWKTDPSPQQRCCVQMANSGEMKTGVVVARKTGRQRVRLDDGRLCTVDLNRGTVTWS